MVPIFLVVFLLLTIVPALHAMDKPKITPVTSFNIDGRWVSMSHIGNKTYLALTNKGTLVCFWLNNKNNISLIKLPLKAEIENGFTSAELLKMARQRSSLLRKS